MSVLYERGSLAHPPRAAVFGARTSRSSTRCLEYSNARRRVLFAAAMAAALSTAALAQEPQAVARMVLIVQPEPADTRLLSPVAGTSVRWACQVLLKGWFGYELGSQPAAEACRLLG